MTITDLVAGYSFAIANNRQELVTKIPDNGFLDLIDQRNDELEEEHDNVQMEEKSINDQKKDNIQGNDSDSLNKEKDNAHHVKSPNDDDLVHKSLSESNANLTENLLYELKLYASGKLSYLGRGNLIEAKSETPSIRYEGLNRTSAASSNSISNAATSETFVTASSVLKSNFSSLTSSVYRNESSVFKSNNSVKTVTASLSLPEYLKKKVTFIGDDENQVFIRDYDLSDSEKRMLISALEKHYKNVGSRLTSVIINGQEYLNR